MYYVYVQSDGMPCVTLYPQGGMRPLGKYDTLDEAKARLKAHVEHRQPKTGFACEVSHKPKRFRHR